MFEPITCYEKPRTTPDTDGFLTPLVPLNWWAAIDALPSLGDSTNTVQYRITMRAHPQVSLWSVFKWDGGGDLFVTGMQEIRRDDKMILLCEMTQP